MSTYWHYECMSHTPPLRSEEFTQHTDDRHFQRGIDLIAQRPVEADNRYWSARYATEAEQVDGYFTMNATSFLAEHPDCLIELVSEYGERRDADGSNPRYETEPERTAVDIAVEAIESAAAWLESLRYETWNGGERRPSNYKRAADDIRRYAVKLKEKANA